MVEHLQYTSLLIRSLYQHGVRHAIISPGSRSTPLTVAAAIHPGIKKKVVLDERSAAFIALGIGKATGKPALLICTSGTALANYYPAVIEAKESGIPLIILSADRPPSLRGIGSSQTIDQLNIFGDRVLYFHEIGEPLGELTDIQRIHSLGQQSVEIATSRGGAVHLNFPFRKPLEPSKEQLNKEILLSKNQFKDAILHEETVIGRALQLNPVLIRLMAASKKPLVICGPSNPSHSLEVLARKIGALLNAPFIAEPGSSVSLQPDDLARYDQYLRIPEVLSEFKPDLILRFGDQPFTKSILMALDAWSERLTIHFSARESMQDQMLSVDYRVQCKPGDEPDLSILQKTSSAGWKSAWKEMDQQSAGDLKQMLAATADLTDGHVFRHLSSTLDNRWNVMLSNSFPARDMALFGSHEKFQFVNRGAAGIDGIISTALGQYISGNRPTCCIIGDLAFLHDTNALLSIRMTDQPFVVVVINNGGGTIFRMLPIAEMDMDELFKTYFETPQQANIQKLSEANAIPYIRITDLGQLKNLDLNTLKDLLIVECVTHSEKSMALRKNLWNK